MVEMHVDQEHPHLHEDSSSLDHVKNSTEHQTQPVMEKEA